MGQHGQHARRGGRRLCVEAGDAGMGVWRAQDMAIGLAGQVDIVGIAPAAGQEAAVFLAADGLAEAELFHGGDPLQMLGRVGGGDCP